MTVSTPNISYPAGISNEISKHNTSQINFTPVGIDKNGEIIISRSAISFRVGETLCFRRSSPGIEHEKDAYFRVTRTGICSFYSERIFFEIKKQVQNDRVEGNKDHFFTEKIEYLAAEITAAQFLTFYHNIKNQRVLHRVYHDQLNLFIQSLKTGDAPGRVVKQTI